MVLTEQIHHQEAPKPEMICEQCSTAAAQQQQSPSETHLCQQQPDRLRREPPTSLTRLFLLALHDQRNPNARCDDEPQQCANQVDQSHGVGDLLCQSGSPASLFLLVGAERRALQRVAWHEEYAHVQSQRDAQEQKNLHELSHQLRVIRQKNLEWPMETIGKMPLSELQELPLHDREAREPADVLGLRVRLDAELEEGLRLDVGGGERDGVEDMLLRAFLHVPHRRKRLLEVQGVDMPGQADFDRLHEPVHEPEGLDVVRPFVMFGALPQKIPLCSRETGKVVVEGFDVLGYDMFFKFHRVRREVEDERQHAERLAEELVQLPVVEVFQQLLGDGGSRGQLLKYQGGIDGWRHQVDLVAIQKQGTRASRTDASLRDCHTPQDLAMTSGGISRHNVSNMGPRHMTRVCGWTRSQSNAEVR
mmetsp:Transcript_35184/g.112163  ORF Transcript_35184/g.112163 Transcript_35184/m.112163 type:complete len:419 (+) Transcript_35184:1095-2351(+)